MLSRLHATITYRQWKWEYRATPKHDWTYQSGLHVAALVDCTVFSAISQHVVPLLRLEQIHFRLCVYVFWLWITAAFMAVSPPSCLARAVQLTSNVESCPVHTVTSTQLVYMVQLIRRSTTKDFRWPCEELKCAAPSFLLFRR